MASKTDVSNKKWLKEAVKEVKNKKKMKKSSKSCATMKGKK